MQDAAARGRHRLTGRAAGVPVTDAVELELTDGACVSVPLPEPIGVKFICWLELAEAVWQ